MFVWMSVAHMALPFGSIGVSEITDSETAVLNSMHASLGDKPGLYMFPGFGLNTGEHSMNRSDAMRNYDAKLVSNPSGLLIYHPPGAKSLTGGQLAAEFLVEMLEAMLAIWLLAQTRITSLGGRIGFVALTGLLASLPTNFSYWNWYGFPADYTAVYMAIQIVGFIVAGTTAAFVLRRQV
jgi:hypothetical protein